eukprot:656820-Rhodomonas_salina.1
MCIRDSFPRPPPLLRMMLTTRMAMRRCWWVRYTRLRRARGMACRRRCRSDWWRGLCGGARRWRSSTSDPRAPAPASSPLSSRLSPRLPSSSPPFALLLSACPRCHCAVVVVFSGAGVCWFGKESQRALELGQRVTAGGGWRGQIEEQCGPVLSRVAAALAPDHMQRSGGGGVLTQSLR